MAWFSGKVSLGNFPDLAGAVNKLQESVKNIEKNFDSALGLEEEPESEPSSDVPGFWQSATEGKTLFDPVRALIGQNKTDESLVDESSSESQSLLIPTEVGESSEKQDSSQLQYDLNKKEGIETEQPVPSSLREPSAREVEVPTEQDDDRPDDVQKESQGEAESESSVSPIEVLGSSVQNNVMSESLDKADHDSPRMSVESPEPTAEISDSIHNLQQKEFSEMETSKFPELDTKSEATDIYQDEGSNELLVQSLSSFDEHNRSNEQILLADRINEPMVEVETTDKLKTEEKEVLKTIPHTVSESSDDNQGEGGSETSSIHSGSTEVKEGPREVSASELSNAPLFDEAFLRTSNSDSHESDLAIKATETNQQPQGSEKEAKERDFSSEENTPTHLDSMHELEKVKAEMKKKETALQGAVRQAQGKADEIEKLMNENEHLNIVIEKLKKKSSDAEIESLREEYHQRVSTLERKVYALTKERDTLRREQNKKSDAASLLKEKDEIINQVMAEGEELSKKQAAQESQIRKLRAQTRELEEEKKGLMTKLQVEENKVDSIKRDKTATEMLLQETIEKHQTELAAQKEYYTSALTAAKEAENLAEARANSEARSELESRLREAEDRETMLVQTLEELRQTLSRKEQQAVFREDMLRGDIEDLQKRYQASERRCEELITQVPESTRPLLRQIEAIQETTARRAEAWASVERSLNSRLQEAEAKSAAAEGRERSINERLSQTLSRINVLEAQVSCLRAEQTQLSKTLEKERQRAAEIRQEYLAAKEEADTQEGRAIQLEEEIQDLRRKHKEELQEYLRHKKLLQQEIEKEKTARMDLERKAHLHSTAASDNSSIKRHNSMFENGDLARKLSSSSSLGNMEESYFLQASLGSSDRKITGDIPMGPYYMKSMNPSSFEAALRQKEGELTSYVSRMKSIEMIRDSLAEELVKLTSQSEKLRAEAGMLPGIRAELEALRRRHSAALELMGERDEELEELRADIVDLKEMYREQVNLLVNKIQVMSSSMGTA
ncbi:golgin candidate 5-like isoform X2 [Cucurbita pepo subsp. pepo]|uniref:golgin candidate 5-like isoform X2 n=1 Tax=Cucurbita pepo subsp. pepo TaxID=3664 RepID=UPI000C9D6D81|nr:golgin candidate 5-like isoform X2 [Cucurbita pepo subsp. pepo]